MERAAQLHFYDKDGNLVDIIEYGGEHAGRILAHELKKRGLYGPAPYEGLVELHLIGDETLETTNHTVAAAVPRRCRRSRACVRVEGVEVGVAGFVSRFVSGPDPGCETSTNVVV